MLKRACVFVLLLTTSACSGGNSTTTSPSNSAATSRSSSTITSPSVTSPSPTPTSGTITFGGFAATANGSAVTTYTESGFTVLATSGNWMVDTYGNPGPSMIFKSTAGAIQVTAGGAAFGFTSIDLYSSTTTIPYTITGLRNSKTTFTMANTLPNTFGNFVTVINSQSADMVDTLVISLTNPHGGNPMGVDNIVLCVPTAGACASPTPTPTPTPSPTPTFSVSGQVTDSATGIGVAGATVSIPYGRNGGQSTTTSAGGTYSLTLQLPPSGLQSLTVFNTSASNYAPQTKELTIYSNELNPSPGAIQVTAGGNLTLSFQLVRANTTITFNGLAAKVGSPVSIYSESGFTVSATSGSWTVDGYGNPGPSIIFESTATGTIQVAAAGAAFGFASLDLYSSTTKIPYTITGLRNSATQFTITNTLPNTFGNFATVANPQAAAMIDTLVISLTNPSPGVNPIGVDNIAVTK
jgi:hypothetical protein